MRLFGEYGYLIFVITNQSGIGRGYYSINRFNILNRWMLKVFEKERITIDSVQYCPHTPKASCLCRKPKTGMIDTILQKYTVDLRHSFLIGDKQSDIDLAHNAGIGNTIAIGTREIQKSSYCFDTIMQCKEYLEENQGKIL